MKLKGLRVDPGRLYGFFDGTAATVQGVVNDCANAGIDTIFVFAYSHAYGAFYRTTAAGAWVEGGYGSEDFLPRLIEAAAARGLKVVATFRMNRFDQMLASNAAWRCKLKSGKNYDTIFSAWHSGYRSYFQSILQDCVVRNPGLAGLEACEGAVALNLEGTLSTMPDWNQAAKNAFQSLYPGGTAGSPQWLDVRALGMTELHQILFNVAKQIPNGESYAVQDLPTVNESSTVLRSFLDYSRQCGYDYRGIANLRPTGMILEAIWQQRAADCPTSTVFTPAWTADAGAQFVSRLTATTDPKRIVHVELTPFSGWATGKYVAPTPIEFEQSLQHAYAAGDGVTIYDYTQVKQGGHFGILQQLFTNVP